MKKLILIVFLVLFGAAAFAQQGVKYKVGDTGPGGGIVFHVEGNGGMEVSRSLGEYNWEDAIEAAKNYKGGGFKDWRLPSKEELNLIYENLQKAKVINLGTDSYWSSSQGNGNVFAWGQNFGDGGQGASGKLSAVSVRAVRDVNMEDFVSEILQYVGGLSPALAAKQTTAYKVGDTGPGGGIVFHVEGNGGVEVSSHLGEYNWEDAIEAAKNYKGGGFKDWRLPSKGELNLIYENLQKAKVINLGTGWHWSSSQYYGNGGAWEQNFGDGVQRNYGKKYTSSVRGVRAF